MLKQNLMILFILQAVGVLSRDVSESERAARASFVQRLLNKRKHLEGNVRLVGGADRYEGNVYIYHGGQWGAVCDDSWDDAAARVVCNGFNKTGVATHGSEFGKAMKKYWMDDVVCQGDEASISQCLFTGWGSSDCDASEVAGVICRDKDDYSIPAKIVRKKGAELRDILDERSTSLRLAGGGTNEEGRVEIYHNGGWGSICPDGWTIYEASTVCRHLGLGYAVQALQTAHYGNSKLVLSGVECEGNETNLFMCRHQQYGRVLCPRESGHVAGVICTDELADLELDYLVIERTSHLQDVMMYQLQCAMEENCLSKSAYEIQKHNRDWQFETRRLLRFTASSLNRGNADFRPYLPKHLWQWHLCHMHYHSMEVFATFDVLDNAGRRIAEGHKASFCLEDNTCQPGIEKRYSCKNYGDQGITVNCSDVYQYNIDCQWVDVTDVAPGDYTFKVAVNPHGRVPEQSYHNNAATCQLRLTTSYASVFGCKHERP